MINLKFTNLLKASAVISLLLCSLAKAEIPNEDVNLPENQCSVFTNKIMVKDMTNPNTKFVYLDNNEYVATNFIVTFIEKAGYISSMVVAAGGDVQSFCFQEGAAKKSSSGSSSSKGSTKTKK